MEDPPVLYNESDQQSRLLGSDLGFDFGSGGKIFFTTSPQFSCILITALIQSSNSTTSTTTIAPEPLPWIFPEDVPRDNDTIDPTIILGQRAAAGEIPWQAFLVDTRSNGDQYICGGSLIRPTWVTASTTQAHPMSFSEAPTSTECRTDREPTYASTTRDTTRTHLPTTSGFCVFQWRPVETASPLFPSPRTVWDH